LEHFRYTTIWNKTIGGTSEGPYKSQIENLRVAFLKMREKTSHLVTRISAVLPGLTQHEISHLDSLWDTASLIVGDEYDINPLEGFILGCAILIHDSALCFEAYENGQRGIRETVQWKDAFAELCESKIHNDIDETKKIADFFALRQLHASQAEKLLEHKWIDPDNHQEIYLLEDQTLRKHFGKLIGKIAASHHWDIELLSSNLSFQQNVLPNFPRDWRIDSIKLACILRCADAAHIDNERAPDFLHALLKRHGISFNHWQAQNRLAKVDIDQSDPKKETLLFTSTIDFTEEEADSWFIAYDAIHLVDKEIKSCNNLLQNRNNYSVFKIKKVRGVESPEDLSKYVKAINWQPCSVQVHVSNIDLLIQNLGGEMLYGTHSDLFGIVIRELIQNSRDAIKARNYFEGEYGGRINIKVLKENEKTWLIIEDNGIGMSERVLTGPLLDFGTSFWTSNLIRSEFPGLRSSSFKPIGKFGIGFYSVFMIATQVYVASRNWDKGMADINLLKFKNGFSLRPILTKGVANAFNTSINTQIKIEVKPEFIPKDLIVEIKTNKQGSKNFNVPFEKYLSAICAGLDVPVYYSSYNSNEVKIHDNNFTNHFDTEKWLIDISFSDYQNEENNKNYISENHSRLKPIIEGNQLFGFAAISTRISQQQDFLSISTVGGLASTVHNRESDKFIGFIDFRPKSAKRETGDFSASEHVIKEWAKDQLSELKKLNLDSIERYCAASALCYFKVDPSSIAHILVSVNKELIFFTFDQLVELSTTIGVVFLEVIYGGHMETYHNINDVPNCALVKPLTNSSFLSLKFDNEIPENNYSIIDCIYRKAIEKGYLSKFEIIKNFAVNTFNQNINAIIFTSKK
jgi:hypothetical protein